MNVKVLVRRAKRSSFLQGCLGWTAIKLAPNHQAGKKYCCNFGLPRPPFTKKIPKLQKIINCISYLVCRLVGKRPSHTKQLKPRFARGSSWVWTNNSSGVYSEARQPLLNSHRKFSQVVCIKPMQDPVSLSCLQVNCLWVDV